LITLLPVIGIVQVGLQSMADRYTYTTQIGEYNGGLGHRYLLKNYRYRHAIGSLAGIIRFLPSAQDAADPRSTASPSVTPIP
jgi:hypothetical protein